MCLSDSPAVELIIAGVGDRRLPAGSAEEAFSPSGRSTSSPDCGAAVLLAEAFQRPMQKSIGHSLTAELSCH